MSWDPFILSLFPEKLKLYPASFTLNAEGFVIGDNPSFRTHNIQCSYPISGGYGHTPRYIYYFLCLIAVLGRKKSWGVSVATGSVMVYSSTTAVHAIVFAIIRQKMVPSFTAGNHDVVLVQGHSKTGLFEWSSGNGPVWLPILPMAWDNDIDPILSIVVSAFVLLLPLQIWSKALESLKGGHKLIILFWTCLLLAGSICSLVAGPYQWFHIFFQFRFCPPDIDDILPILNSGAGTPIPSLGQHDRYRWNRTVNDYFTNKNFTNRPANNCLYPCFQAEWPLRNPTEIHVVDGGYGSQTSTGSFYRLMFATYGLLVLSSLGQLTAAVIKYAPWVPSRYRQADIRLSWRNLVYTFKSGGTNGRFSYFAMILLAFWMFWVSLYALVLTPIALICLVTFQEYIIWTSDPIGENFMNIGQWGTLVAAVLIITAALMAGTAARVGSNPLPANSRDIISSPDVELSASQMKYYVQYLAEPFERRMA
ncbi:hypothetical protein FQN50_007586 [Emmonsiellopsis sp. PD_5]|nr:hypothetical protein FQN50_007586 [Emmonsiellopsis sp. PD_5]